jgi:hypothetical protein
MIFLFNFSKPLIKLKKSRIEVRASELFVHLIIVGAHDVPKPSLKKRSLFDLFESCLPAGKSRLSFRLIEK